MSYKKKVEKALELIGKKEKSTLESIVRKKYNTNVFQFEDLALLVRYNVVDLNEVGEYSDDLYCICLLLHIKTLEQFEQLYFSLTGKELGDD